MTAKKLALMSVLTAIALIVFIIEAQIPLPVPVPGAKLGLANAVTLFALFFRKRGDGLASPANKRAVCQNGDTGSADKTVPPPETDHVLKATDALMILVCRIILGAVFTGRVIAFIYSVTGGVFAFGAMAVLRKFVTGRQVWVCGAIGAVFHNIGQIGAAMIITGTPAIAAYLPALIIAGVVTGVVTGLTAQFAVQRVSGER